MVLMNRYRCIQARIDFNRKIDYQNPPLRKLPPNSRCNPPLVVYIIHEVQVG